MSDILRNYIIYTALQFAGLFLTLSGVVGYLLHNQPLDAVVPGLVLGMYGVLAMVILLRVTSAPRPPGGRKPLPRATPRSGGVLFMYSLNKFPPNPLPIPS